jgi:hypothetical protein
MVLLVEEEIKAPLTKNPDKIHKRDNEEHAEEQQ